MSVLPEVELCYNCESHGEGYHLDQEVKNEVVECKEHIDNHGHNTTESENHLHELEHLHKTEQALKNHDELC